MGLGLLVCERNSGPDHRRAVDMVANRDIGAAFSFPVFINKSARKKDAVVDRTNLSPKFPLPRTPNELSIWSLSLQGPPRLTDPAPDPLVARRDLSIGTSFAPSLWFRRFTRLGFAWVGFGPRFAQLRTDFARGVGSMRVLYVVLWIVANSPVNFAWFFWWSDEGLGFRSVQRCWTPIRAFVRASCRDIRASCLN